SIDARARRDLISQSTSNRQCQSSPTPGQTASGVCTKVYLMFASGSDPCAARNRSVRVRHQCATGNKMPESCTRVGLEECHVDSAPLFPACQPIREGAYEVEPGDGQTAAQWMETMYPLPVVLIGIDENDLPEVREALSHAEAQVESEFPFWGNVMECLRSSKERTRLLILQLSESQDELVIERLSGHFNGWPILVLAPGDVSPEAIQNVYRAGARQVVRLPLD